MYWALTFVVTAAVATAYVQIFNKVATMYFESDQTMTWMEFYRHYVPAMDIQIKI